MNRMSTIQSQHINKKKGNFLLYALKATLLDRPLLNDIMIAKTAVAIACTLSVASAAALNDIQCSAKRTALVRDTSTGNILELPNASIVVTPETFSSEDRPITFRLWGENFDRQGFAQPADIDCSDRPYRPPKDLCTINGKQLAFTYIPATCERSTGGLPTGMKAIPQNSAPNFCDGKELALIRIKAGVDRTRLTFVSKQVLDCTSNPYWDEDAASGKAIRPLAAPGL